VPSIIKWPGVTKPGAKCDVPIISMDYYPTMLEMAGLPQNPEQHVDGVNLSGLLKGGKSLGREAIYFHFPHYHHIDTMEPAGQRARRRLGRPDKAQIISTRTIR